jgi:hypothetical protein
MNKLIVLIIFALFASLPAKSQYRVNKNNYSTANYSYQKGDKVVPAVAGVASFFIPGLGQALSGEYARGAAFFGGFSGGAALYYTGARISHNTGHKEFGFENDEGLIFKIIGIGSMVSLRIASMVDAMKVAKVNNMAFRDKNDNITAQLSILPYSRFTRMEIGSFKETGLSLTFRF